MLKKLTEAIENISVTLSTPRPKEEKADYEQRLQEIEFKVSKLWLMLTEPTPRNPEKEQLTKTGRTFKTWLRPPAQ